MACRPSPASLEIRPRAPLWAPPLGPPGAHATRPTRAEQLRPSCALTRSPAPTPRNLPALYPQDEVLAAFVAPATAGPPTCELRQSTRSLCFRGPGAPQTSASQAHLLHSGPPPPSCRSVTDARNIVGQPGCGEQVTDGLNEVELVSHSLAVGIFVKHSNPAYRDLGWPAAYMSLVEL